ncbi:hypothetical protein AVEN_250266-1 [Araneus ventricosus]|uniref:RNase H type-1 domain-containing protein n=1 Tax=Araneus ventricosus TaxID=182803 RepID=A0A4Y2GVV8_ARAVE|nr:hypothetical protein AVEN_238306-1 [Araneus ventricosus]GBM56658.1 hypothetical protein AVEN_250266-1 [Araneus ventricosus]
MGGGQISWSLFDECQTFGTIIYIDDSKIQNRVGHAFVHFQENDEIFSELFRLFDEATVFMAEVMAIRQAVKCIIRRQLRQAKIISDSQSALMSLASLHERRLIVNEIKDNIREYLGDIQLIWIRAHRGFKGNKRAHQLAKLASTKDHVDFSFCPSRIQIKNAARREILEAWQQRWSGSSNARRTYSLLSKVDSKRIYGDFFLNQVSTGHGAFPCHHASLFGKDPQRPCRRADGSIFHVLFECQKKKDSRGSTVY